MATQYPKLVNKQFNSPIKLYSPQNVQEIMERETQILANGAMGIDFHQLAKPANLKNSAVLRMLEEEENRKRNGQPNLKQVIWPPPPDSDEYNSLSEESPVYAQGGPQYHNQQPSPVQQQHKSVSPQPTSPQFGAQQQQQPKAWASVHSPVSAAPQPQFQPAPAQPQVYRPVEPPPVTIVLRPQPPISQAPAPVYTSQPATASLNGGANMRGDQKWPPATVKAQVQAENEMRQQLAKGPACRPRKVKKDYSAFFAQHALNQSYPGYRAPPGTQHYTEEQTGVSSY